MGSAQRKSTQENAWVEKKRVGNHFYDYLRWRDANGRQPSMYLGRSHSRGQGGEK